MLLHSLFWRILQHGNFLIPRHRWNQSLDQSLHLHGSYWSFHRVPSRGIQLPTESWECQACSIAISRGDHKMKESRKPFVRHQIRVGHCDIKSHACMLLWFDSKTLRFCVRLQIALSLFYTSLSSSSLAKVSLFQRYWQLRRYRKNEFQLRQNDDYFIPSYQTKI